MRFIVCVPGSVAAGLCAGLVFFHQGAPRPTLTVTGEADISASRQADLVPSGNANRQRLVAAATRKDGGADRDNELYLAIEAFTAEDFRRLLSEPGALKELAEKLRDIRGEVRRGLGLTMISRWLALEPGTVKTWAARLLELLPEKESLRESFRDALAIKCPEEMLALSFSEKDVEGRQSIISKALRELAMKDPEKARAWLAGCTDAADRKVAEQAMRKGLVRADPLRAIELAGSTESRVEARELLDEAANWAAKKGPGALRQLATMSMPQWMLSPLLRQLAAVDPEMALDLAIKSGPDGDGENSALQSAFSFFAKRAPAEAIAKLEGLNGTALLTAVSAIGQQWAQSEPAEALSWLATRPASERMLKWNWSSGTKDVLLNEFGRWAAQEKNEARAWADALPTWALRDSVEKQLAQALAFRGEAAEAVQILARLSGGVEPKDIAEIAGQWAKRDPQSAAGWALAQPAGPVQNKALAKVVRAWADDNPRGVEDWLAQFPPGDARDRSVLAYLDRNGAEALTNSERIAEFDGWLGQIDDPWRRAQAATEIYWRRERRDPLEARAWLSALPNVDAQVVRMLLRKTTY